MRAKASAAEWADRVRAWHESGQEAEAFAEYEGYSATLLRWWSSELARRTRRTTPVRLARVAPAATPLTVSVGSARIEVLAGFDPLLLRAVVSALGDAQ